MGAIEVLKRCEVFLGLDDADLQKVVNLPSCKEHNYPDKEVIFKIGEEARHLFILVNGQVDLVMQMSAASAESPKHTVVNVIGTGGVFGWRALVPPHIFGMSAISKGQTKLLAIGGAELRGLFDRHPNIGYEVTQSLLRVILSRYRNIEELLLIGARATSLDRMKRRTHQA
jgi:CRP-like cAMP-binding protein